MTDRCHACGELYAPAFVITAVNDDAVVRSQAPCTKCGERHPTMRKSARPVAVKRERKSVRINLYAPVAVMTDSERSAIAMLDARRTR